MERYCLFIDESGVPELSAKSDFCILTGVMIKADDEKSFLFLIKRIKERYKLDLNRHIHAVDIFENVNEKCFLGKTSKRTKKDLRENFQKDMWDLIKDYGLKHYTVTVPKNTVKELLGLMKQPEHGQDWIKNSNFYAKVDRQLPMDVGVNVIYAWALEHLKKDDSLEVIFESRSGDQFTVRNFGYIQDKNVFKDKKMRQFSQQWKKRVVSIAFANKGVNLAGLELADVISYTSNIYYLQMKKKTVKISKDLEDSICFKGIHKTLNKTHYIELNRNNTRMYLPGLSSRTKRIAEYYSSCSLSPANAGAQI